MSIEMQALEEAIDVFDREADDDFVDLRRLSASIDRLTAKQCRAAAAAKKRGDHQPSGQSPCSWAAKQCQMSPTSAADRICVGEQLANLPEVARALTGGQLGYQAAAVICRLSEDVGKKRDNIVEEDWIRWGQNFSVRDLRYLAREARVRWDCEGFDKETEDNYELRSLDISETFKGMYRVDGWLDPVTGAAFKTAIESLAKPLGAGDQRTARQRRADAVGEVAVNAMNDGRLPRRNGVRPHIGVSTTIEGLKGELGGAVSKLENGTPISSKTVQRLACDGSLHRVLKADSVIVDVGRATRAVSPAQWRALKARHRTCSFPGCDRPLSMTNPHHLEFWAHGGRSDMSNLVPLCYYHHRLVHEGDWQVVRAGDGVKFVPPERVFVRRMRWGERRWAA